MGEIVRLPDSDRDGRSSLGVTLYLVATSLIFGGLLFLFLLLRGVAHPWPPEEAALPQILPAFAAVLCGTISLILHLGVRDVSTARLARFQLRITIAVLLALLFTGVGSALWVRVASMPGPTPSPLHGLLFMLLSLMGMHAIAGLLLLGWLRQGIRRGRLHARNSTPVRLVARIWHFLTVAWLAIYVSIFLL